MSFDMISFFLNLLKKQKPINFPSNTKIKKSLTELEQNLKKLIPITIGSIYKIENKPILLPAPLNQLVNSAAESLIALEKDVENAGGQLILSDGFRSYDMQMQAFLDWKTGKKQAYSPPPDSSYHEAGRAIDISLSDLNMRLIDFWVLAKKRGWIPIIAKPNSRASEAWHFEFREYFADIIPKFGYRKSAYLAIRDIGLRDDAKSLAMVVQMHLYLQGFYDGELDGIIGKKSTDAILNFKSKYELPIETSMDPYFVALLKNFTYDKFRD